MQNMLAYTIRGGLQENDYPQVVVRQGSSPGKFFAPNPPTNDSYWIYFLDRSNPSTLVYQTVIPGANNSSVPAGLLTYLENVNLLYGVVTQNLNTLHVPQGDFYDLLVVFGAGRALQRLEQVNTTLSCGYYGRMSYALIGQGGPRDKGQPAPASYDAGDLQHGVLLTVSLMPQHDGKPPYSICDCNTFTTRK
jgi:hypothetical protein